MRTSKMGFLVAVVVVAAGCQARPTAAPSQPPQGSVTVPATVTQAATSEPIATRSGAVGNPGSLLTLSGDTWTISQPIELDTAMTVAIAWEYTGTGPFAVWMVNTAEEVLDPAYDRILVVDAPGASNGSMDTYLIRGVYALEVELADGPWVVEVGEGH